MYTVIKLLQCYLEAITCCHLTTCNQVFFSYSLFWIYLICMVVYISDGVWHFAQLCPHQGEYILFNVMCWVWYSDVALRCFYCEACDWATMYDKKAHCVSMTWMFCCVTEKSLLTLSLLVTIVIMMLFVWTRPVRALMKHLKSSQMMLIEYTEEVSLQDLW